MYSNYEIAQAREELTEFVEHMAGEALAKGWTYEETSQAPESFKALKGACNNKHIPIANYACDTSIYLTDKANIMFRFWHDVCHLELGCGFSKDGEYKAISLQLEEAMEYGLSNLAITMFYYDTIGQVEYYFKNKRFIDNQMMFCRIALEFGLNRALKCIV